MSNHYLIESKNVSNISKALKAFGRTSAHFTNGIYDVGLNLITPTILAGFQFVMDNEQHDSNALIIAINSDVSTANIMDKNIHIHAQKVKSLEEILKTGNAPKDELEKAFEEVKNAPIEKERLINQKENRETQFFRAIKATTPLAQQNSSRKVISIFYDEETPLELYTGLKQQGFTIASLFKWGYGTTPNQGIIVGQDQADVTYGFPFPNDDRPICHNMTPRGDNSKVIVHNLCSHFGPHGQPYITTKNYELGIVPNKLLIPAHHPNILPYTAKASQLIQALPYTPSPA